MKYQQTIQKPIKCSGIGLHSGKRVELRLIPAEGDSGINFEIKKGGISQKIKPTPQNVADTGLATTLGNKQVRVATVEHLMAAIMGLGIDNLLIQVEGQEIPIMDGSATSFVYLLRSAGLKTLSAPKKIYKLKRDIYFDEDGKSIKGTPYDGFKVRYTIDFKHPLVGVQTFDFELSPESFDEISRARTFGFLKDVEYLRKNGLALGGSLENAVVLDEFGVMNSEGLRYENELVRHKILDFIGDLAIMGRAIHGYYEVYCSGHALNNKFLRCLEENKDYYLQEKTLAKPHIHPQPDFEFDYFPGREPAWA